MQKISIAGLQVNTESEQEIENLLRDRLQHNQKTFVVTPYSEFLYAALRNSKTMSLLNKAHISIPDGIAILLARTFLEQPYSFRWYWAKVVQGWWQMFWLGWRTLLKPQTMYGPFSGKLVGAEFVWVLAKLAEQQKQSIYILGGFDKTPELAAQKLQQRYPGLQVVGTSNKSKTDPTILEDIKQAQPDILMVGFGPITQEQWLMDNWEELPIKVGIGLGGTFDYLAGYHTAPPAWMRQAGLEWLYRLFTQPKRFFRIKNATFGLVNALINYKASL